MLRFRLALFCLVLLALAPVGTARLGAEIYTWVDNDGVIHIANRPKGSNTPVIRRATAGSTRLNQPTARAAAGDRYDEIIRRAAARYDLDYSLVKAVVHAESAFNPRAVSRKGAQGLMQLMPQTARGLGVSDVFDPEENILGGSRYLRKMLDRYNHDLPLSLAAYNAGPGAVDRTGGVPPYRETQDYIRRVKWLMQRYGGGSEGGTRIYRVVKNGRVLLTDRPLP